jgi:hypothetical protein
MVKGERIEAGRAEPVGGHHHQAPAIGTTVAKEAGNIPPIMSDKDSSWISFIRMLIIPAETMFSPVCPELQIATISSFGIFKVGEVFSSIFDEVSKTSKQQH